MHLDLSTLSIPPPEIIPEPTAENLEAFAAFCEEANSGTDEFMVESLRDRWPATAIYFARRCRELEAEVKRLKQVGRDFTPGLAESTYDD